MGVEINKIYNEDCFITMSNMDDNFVDIVMTSPPYNMTSRKGGYADSGRYDVYEDWMTESEYIDFTIKLFNNFNRVVKENGVVIYNFSYSIENPSLPYKLVAEIVDQTEWCVADTIMWKKDCGLPFPANERRLSRNWEFVWIFVRKNEIDTFKCNIMTIHQSVPINGIASLTLSIDVFYTEDKVDEMVSKIEEVEGVRYAKIIARE